MSRDLNEFEIGQFERISRARNRVPVEDPFETVPLTMGMEMFIHTRIGFSETRPISTHLIGYEKGQYLILATPKVNGMMIKYQENKPITIHYLANKAVFSFSTMALRVLGPPFYMTVFKAPDQIEETFLRSSPRLPVGIPFERPGGDTAKEFIVNIGAGGALLKLSEKMPINSQFRISFYLPNGEAVNGIPVNVKRVDMSQGKMMAGVELDTNHPGFSAIGQYINFVLGAAGIQPESYDDAMQFSVLEKYRGEAGGAGG